MFLVDTGRTVRVDIDRVLPLSEDMLLESNSIKHLAFLFNLKVVAGIDIAAG